MVLALAPPPGVKVAVPVDEPMVVGLNVTSNEQAWAGDLKVGETYDVARRVCSLNTACRYPHVAIAVAPTFDSKRDEKKVHRRLAAHLCDGTREFFNTAVSTAVNALKEEVEEPFWVEFARRTQAL